MQKVQVKSVGGVKRGDFCAQTWQFWYRKQMVSSNFVFSEICWGHLLSFILSLTNVNLLKEIHTFTFKNQYIWLYSKIRATAIDNGPGYKFQVRLIFDGLPDE